MSATRTAWFYGALRSGPPKSAARQLLQPKASLESTVDGAAAKGIIARSLAPATIPVTDHALLIVGLLLGAEAAPSSPAVGDLTAVVRAAVDTYFKSIVVERDGTAADSDEVNLIVALIILLTAFRRIPRQRRLDRWQKGVGRCGSRRAGARDDPGTLGTQSYSPTGTSDDNAASAIAIGVVRRVRRRWTCIRSVAGRSCW